MSFAAFWAAYPRKVGKIAAEKAYRKALKLAGHDELMDGVARYLKSKPPYADWCHPATWLNQGRWMDESATFSAVKHHSSLEDIAAHINRPWYQFGRYHPDIVQQCVEAGLVTPERAREVL